MEKTTKQLSKRKHKVKCRKGWGNTMYFLTRKQGFQAHIRAFAHSAKMCIVLDFPDGAVVRVCLLMQGTWVWALVQEDPKSRGATKPRVPQLLSLRSRAREPQLMSSRATTTEACTPRARALQQENPPQWEACAPQWRVAPTRHS